MLFHKVYVIVVCCLLLCRIIGLCCVSGEKRCLSLFYHIVNMVFVFRFAINDHVVRIMILSVVLFACCFFAQLLVRRVWLLVCWVLFLLLLSYYIYIICLLFVVCSFGVFSVLCCVSIEKHSFVVVLSSCAYDVCVFNLQTIPTSFVFVLFL